MCLDGDGTFTCKCAPGWTGKFRFRSVNQSPKSTTTINSSTQTIFSCCLYHVHFVRSILGKTCTERISQCYNGQCANGGTCAPIIIGGEAASVCVCANGFGGAFCTETVDQCQGQPCFNGGTCESGNGWFRCACAQGFTGPDCRINVNECAPQPCLGGGTCIDGIGKYECLCPKDRRGSRCEIGK